MGSSTPNASADCNDGDPSVHPGDVPFSPSPAMASGFDYDRSGKPEPKDTTWADCVFVSDCQGERCVYRENGVPVETPKGGWFSLKVAATGEGQSITVACGASGHFTTGSCFPKLLSGYTCETETVTRVQTCR